MVRIDKAVVRGVFSLDGQDFDVDNNVWLIGDDEEVLVVDAPHDAAPIVDAVGGRRVTAIVLTHGHNDHITARHATTPGDVVRALDCRADEHHAPPARRTYDD